MKSEKQWPNKIFPFGIGLSKKNNILALKSRSHVVQKLQALFNVYRIRREKITDV